MKPWVNPQLYQAEQKESHTMVSETFSDEVAKRELEAKELERMESKMTKEING